MNEEKVNLIGEKLRHMPYRSLPTRYNCFGKCLQFQRECLEIGVKARVIVCAGIAEMTLFGILLKVPMIHGWCEVDGRKVEITRPLDNNSRWGGFYPVIRLYSSG